MPNLGTAGAQPLASFSKQLGWKGSTPHRTRECLDDPEHLVLGVIDYAFPSMSAYVSFDGGERWGHVRQRFAD